MGFWNSYRKKLEGCYFAEWIGVLIVDLNQITDRNQHRPWRLIWESLRSMIIYGGSVI